jgi:hypothetical protein
LQTNQRERRAERAFIAKQKALLDAAEAVTRYLSFYGSIANKTLPEDGVVPEVTELAVALNGLHFYCDLETIQQVLHLSKLLSEAMGEAVKERLDVVFLANDVRVIEKQIENIEKTNGLIQQEITALLHSEPRSPIIGIHRQQLVQNNNHLGTLRTRLGPLLHAKYLAIEKCRDVVKKNLPIILESARDILLFARKELNFPIVEKQYRLLIDENIATVTRFSNELIVEVRKKIDEKIKERQ